MKSIVLKHLAREFDIDPRKLRALLRSKEVPTENGRYQWTEGTKKLERVRGLIGKELSKSPDKPTPSQIDTRRKPIPQIASSK